MQIIENGHGYTVDGDVYFSVDKFPDYGRLSGRKLEDNRAGERVAIDSRKKHPGDFAMWKVVSVDSQKVMIMYALAVYEMASLSFYLHRQGCLVLRSFMFLL